MNTPRLILVQSFYPFSEAMTRLSIIILLTLIGTSLSCSTPPSDPHPPLRNILFIMGDDHAAYALGAYGSPIAQTPTLDRLAADGIRFDRAYVNTPICTPSRQSILTSKLPHASGVNLLFTPLSRDEVTIADHLKAQGFATGAIGKMHFNSNPDFLRSRGYDEAVVQSADDHHGFDLRIDRQDHRQYLETLAPRSPPSQPVRPPWQPFRDPARTWLNADAYPGNQPDSTSVGTYFAQRAIDFLQANQDNRFCLWLSFYEPHSPFNFPLEYADSVDPAQMPVPDVGPEDDRWIPAVFRDLTDQEKRGINAAYYTSVNYLDKNIGLVVDALDRLGLTDSTLIVYVGDHGYLLGHHGRFEKHMMWEEAVRAPLILKNTTRFGRGRSTDALVEFIDLVPTILDGLGVPAMETAQGQSLMPLLDGKTEQHREAIFSEMLNDNKAMIRTERWKYIFTTGAHDLSMGYETGLPPPGITHRLYDLANDPGETTSLANDPTHTATLVDLQQRMLQRFKDTHPNAEALPPDLPMDQALAWFCEPPDPRPTVEIQ